MESKIGFLYSRALPGVLILIATLLLYFYIIPHGYPTQVKGLKSSISGSDFVNISWEPESKSDRGYRIFVSHGGLGSWETRKGLDKGLKYGIGFAINDTGYVGLGNLGGIDRIKELWAYDPANDSWVRKADMGGEGRENAVSFVINDAAYAGTGFSTSFTKDFWKYLPSNDTWVKVEDFRGQSRTEAVGFSIAGKGYVGTGYSEINGCLVDFWEYNASDNSWTRRADFGGSPRRAAWSFVIGNKGYIGNGVCGGSFPADFWEYDALNDTWTLRSPSLPWGNTNYAYGFSSGKKGYVLLRESQEFWEYEAGDNSWARMADFIGDKRFSPTGFVIEERAYVGTGSIGTVMYKDFYEFSPRQQLQSENWELRAYTRNSFFNDTNLRGHIHKYMVSANDTCNNWGENSSVMIIED